MAQQLQVNTLNSNMTLYRRCIWTIASLIRKGYWCEANSNHLYNPFSFLPSSTVDDLISCVIQFSSPGSLKVTDLYNLLTSGRVENFKLDDILISIEDLVAILMSLSTSSQNVRSLTFRNVICSDPHYSESYNSKIFKEEKALECLLRISPQLESLESCISFDLKVIRNCEKLKVLKLNFTRTKPLYDFLEEADGHFWPNNSLRIFEIFEDVRNPVPYFDLVPILQCCTELTQVNANISRSLEFLHTEELYKGTLTAQYKLQKCILGSTLIDNGAATLLGLHIATLTCPEIREVDVLVNDNEAIYALSDFKKLSSLLIQWELPSGGDFQLGVQLMLEKIGANLKIFHLLNFYNVDIAVIATMCPLLEVLKLEIHSEYRGYECPEVCFQHLTSLHVELMELDIGCHEDTLCMLLSHCVNLTTLHIEGAQNLNDRNLSQILAKNHLSSLKEAVLFDCNLSEVGIRNLVSHLNSLEFFHFSSSQIGFEDAAHIVHEVHPHVIFVADEGF